MENLNISIASEFIWMASELLYYKTVSLLPSKELEDEYFVPPLPPELIERLLEYKKFQQTSSDLRSMFENQHDLFPRINNLDSLQDDEALIEVSLFDLLRAFANVLESHSEIKQEEIIFDEILVSDKIDYIIDLLKEKEIILFIDLFYQKPGRAEIISSFLAILEMSKTQLIKLYQHKAFGDIRIKRNYSLKDL